MKKQRKYISLLVAGSLCGSMMLEPSLAAQSVSEDTTVTSNPYGGETTQKTTTRTWEDTTPSEPEDGWDGVTTTTVGQETKIDLVSTDHRGNTVEESGSVKGRETIAAWTEKAEASKERREEELPEKSTEMGDWGESHTQTGSWSQGTEEIVDSEKSDIAYELNEITALSLEDPLKDGAVELELHPGSATAPLEAREERYVDLEELVSENITFPEKLVNEDGSLKDTYTEQDGDTQIIYRAIYAKDGETILGYSIVKRRQRGEDSLQEGEATSGVSVGVETKKVAPQGYTEGEVTLDITDEDGTIIGQKTIKTEAIYGEEDTSLVIGYRITTTTEREDIVVDEESSSKAIYLPARPSEGTVENEDGTTTVTTVTDILGDDGEVIGYQSTITRMQGSTVLSTGVERIYGTREIIATRENKVCQVEVKEVYGERETEVTTSTEKRTMTIERTYDQQTESSQLMEGEEGIYFLYEGKMDPVQAQSGHGRTTFQTIRSELENSEDGSFDTEKQLYMREKETEPIVEGGSPAGNFYWDGTSGVESMIRVDSGGGGELSDTYRAYQFILKDRAGNEYSVYCADFEVGPVVEAQYKIENVEDAGYYTEEDARHIRAIAENGYWGTAEGMGSLDAVKALLKAAGEDDAAEALTPGEAITATQAAIWRYGNSGAAIPEEFVGRYYTAEGFGTTPEGSKERIKLLYDLLIAQSPTEAETTLITEENFATQVLLTLKSKEQDTQGEVTYLTDLSFTLLMEPDERDDLVVTLFDESEAVLAQKRLAGSDDETGYGMLSPETAYDGDGNAVGYLYTLEGLSLTAGTELTLVLSGSQVMENGAYLYTATGGYTQSQSFIGFAQGERSVDLGVKLSFSVSEPEANKSVQSDSCVCTEQYKRTDSKTERSTRERDKVSTEVKERYTDHTTADRVRNVESTQREWESSYLRTYHYSYGRDPDPDPTPKPTPTPAPSSTPTPEPTSTPEPEPEPTPAPTPEPDPKPDEEEPSAEIEVGPAEEEKVISSVPRTGDVSPVWYTTCMMSGLGLLLMKGKSRKKKSSKRKRH